LPYLSLGNQERIDTEFLQALCDSLGDNAVIIVLGNAPSLVGTAKHLSKCTYQTYITVYHDRLHTNTKFIPASHSGALIYTKYKGPLQHCKTRLAYTFCPACDKTTKDYGGKKHIFHHFGTAISDVWRDGVEEGLPQRFAQMFGLEPHKNLWIVDLKLNSPLAILPDVEEVPINPAPQSQLICGDCIEELKKLDDNCIDFEFVDPPYNLKKKYASYEDDLEIESYFRWCDEWLDELVRVLKPGRTLAVLNIPLWCIRHFHHLETKMHYQNWIAWDGLSNPVKKIMPAHYGILCFSKGPSRELPMYNQTGITEVEGFQSLNPLEQGYCLRASCIKKREDVRGKLSDLWWDIHRLKHNNRRVDHPCLLPPNLMYRLFSIFTKPGETILDCFNGAGTSTLAAHQLGREYFGIELDKTYHQIALDRHQEIKNGLNPFRKEKRILTSKNSNVPRVKKGRRRYSKKEVQLDIRRIADVLGHVPTQKEYLKSGKFSAEIIEEYFFNWGEACAAARTTGMTEIRAPKF